MTIPITIFNIHGLLRTLIIILIIIIIRHRWIAYSKGYSVLSILGQYTKRNHFSRAIVAVGLLTMHNFNTSQTFQHLHALQKPCTVSTTRYHWIAL